MNVQNALNRGFNLLATSIVGLAGFAFASEIFAEQDWDDKTDDILLLLLGIATIIWYATGRRRFERSVVPVIAVILGLVIKIGAVIVEFSDVNDVGDDMGGVALFALATILVLYQYNKTRRLLEEAK